MKRFLCQFVVWSVVVFLDPVGHAWGQSDSKLAPAPSGFASRRDDVERAGLRPWSTTRNRSAIPAR